MLNLQHLSRHLIRRSLNCAYTTPAIPLAVKKISDRKPEATDSVKNVPTAITTDASKNLSKNPLVMAAFQSLKESDAPSAYNSAARDNTTSQLDELILKANTANELLLLVDGHNGINRRHALKAVSILAEWSSIGRVKLAEFENDPRFLKLCRLLGRAVASKSNGIGNNKKSTSSVYRTDDLNTVLAVAGDDEAAKLIASLSLPQMIKVTTQLATKKRRSTPLLRALSFNIGSHAQQLDLKQCGDLLYALSMLNFHDNILMEKVCNDVQSSVTDTLDKSAAIGSILTSLGLMKYKNVDVMECLAKWTLSHLSICRLQDTAALIMTLAVLDYTPVTCDISKICLNKDDFAKNTEWLNYVWSCVILNIAKPEQIESVLCSGFAKQLKPLSPNIKRKLLNIDAVAEHLLKDKYRGPRISYEDVYDVPLVHNKSKQLLVQGMLDALNSLLSSKGNCCRTNVDTKMGFVIDAECVLDNKRNPLPVDQEHTNATRVAIMVLDYHDICHGISQQGSTGMVALSSRLLASAGFRVLPVPYTEFNTSEKLLKRAQYLEKKLKEICKD